MEFAPVSRYTAEAWNTECRRYQPLSSLTIGQLRQRAQEYRDMAATARTVDTCDGLLRLAARFDTMAETKARSAAPD